MAANGKIGANDVAFYRERGYLLVPGVLDEAELVRLRAVTDEILDRARSMRESDGVLDLDEGHTPEAPRVRRIKLVTRAHPYYRELLRHPRVVGVLTALLGASVRELGGKLNVKAARHGTPVEWHQDWAYYPHTNDDVLAVGLPIDDVGPDNAPLMVLPGSHKGPIYDHLSGGVFCGAIDRASAGLEVSGAVALTAPAGTMTVHHVRMVHGSDLNRSNRPRRMLFYECAAGDAWPLAIGTAVDYDGLCRDMVVGEPSLTPRMEALPVRMPYPAAREIDNSERGTLYEKQRLLRNPSFERPAAP
jgi:ectoine hydroxylase-related dioxygenase (phytanoyl-CoA dioxygenase family)